MIVILLVDEVLYTGLIEMQELDAPGIQNALHLLHKVVSLICTLITKYHFIPSNLQRHNRQLGY